MIFSIRHLLAILLRDKAIYSTSIAIIVCTIALFQLQGMELKLSSIEYVKAVLRALIITLSIYAIGYLFYLAKQRVRRPVLQYWLKVREVLDQPEELVNFVLLSLILSVVFSCYSAVKSLIPVINPFFLDPFLGELDRVLHFGVDPWRLSHLVFSHPIATAVINLLYHLWFFVLWIFLISFQMRISDQRLREKVLLVFILSWALNGGIIAILTSSAGPCFFAYLYPGATDFAPLMDRLVAQNTWLSERGSWITVWALDVQTMLWDRYQSVENSLGSGISSLPSMHVAVAMLVALSVNAVNKRWGAVAWLYLLSIQIGSVHLAWHYAVDGYFSIVFVFILWKIVGFWQCRKAREAELTTEELSTMSQQ